MNGFIVRSKTNPTLILCTNNEFKYQDVVGAGGYSAKVYKTQSGAEKARNGKGIIVEKYEQE